MREKSGDIILQKVYNKPKNFELNISNEDYDVTKKYALKIFKDEKKRMWKVYNKLEELEGINSTLLSAKIQNLTGMPKSREYTDNIDVVHKKNELIKSIKALQKPYREFNEIIKCGDPIQQSVTRAMYTNRMRAFEIAIKYNISERYVWELINQLINQYIRSVHSCS